MKFWKEGNYQRPSKDIEVGVYIGWFGRVKITTRYNIELDWPISLVSGLGWVVGYPNIFFSC